MNALLRVAWNCSTLMRSILIFESLYGSGPVKIIGNLPYYRRSDRLDCEIHISPLTRINACSDTAVGGRRAITRRSRARRNLVP